MAPPQKSGKVATKGAKQIVEDNLSTLYFYKLLSIITYAISLLILTLYSTTWNIVFFISSAIISISAYQFMAYMAISKYSETGQLLDSGVDLNMDGGIAEHVKDIIILTCCCQLLSSVVSNYFWFLWLFAPIRAVWILWKNVLAPYFFQPSAAEPEISEKKQKKMERRMRRKQ